MNRLTPFGLLFVALTVAFTVVGQLAVKSGMGQVGSSPTQPGDLLSFLLRAFTNPRVVFGLVCAVVASAAWTVAVSRVPITVAYPFLSLGMVLVLAFGGAVFGEAVPLTRWIGVLIVFVGIVIASLN